MDVARLIQRFSTTPGTAGPGQYNVRRRSDAGFVNGIAQLGALTSFVVTGSVQPIAAQDLQRLPELRRNQTAVTFFTSTPLSTGEEGGSSQADRVEVDAGVWYEVQECDVWRQPNGAIHYRCILQRPPTPNVPEEQP